MIRRRVAVALICGLPTVAGAEKSAYVYGAGTVSCGQWSDFRSRNDPNRFQIQAWVDGYLSGNNVADDRYPDFLVLNHDQAGIYAWLDNYCLAHPLDQVIQGTTELKRELILRSK